MEYYYHPVIQMKKLRLRAMERIQQLGAELRFEPNFLSL